ncbi:hypothetical protein QAD02_004274 [Eretmocerus hayati]|uniref:Uncharacterized protein n=1 Tax=Eretmocerus hayati TaxID=131215 RepID=A0ACC2NP89_9HYME|nr:hypothetical protein QAD02_004274 [Eretmocerus hayati]
MSTVAKKFVFSKQFIGEPKPSDLTLVEEQLPPVKDGEILVEAEYLSLDPYMRAYTVRLPIGSTMIGSQVAKIVESKNPKFSAGQRMVGYLGWRSHTVFNPERTPPKEQIIKNKPYVLPNFGDLSPSLALGVLGMPGNTAYFGLTEICAAKSGETLVISGAGGAVGSHVGQIGTIMGMHTIGIAGTDEKCKWLVEELDFDKAINYKSQNVAAALKEAAPKGVDCYFDNVGGDISTTVIYQMKDFGRVAVCGSISSYNSHTLPKTNILQPALVFKQLKIEGFLVNRWSDDRWFEGIQRNMSWIREGKLKYRETVTEGFENMFAAFVGMLRGDNTGKAIVKV